MPLSIFDELMRRDFTKRQRCILLMVCRFSIALSKETAKIPKLNHFKLSGLSPTKIQSEIQKLIKLGVLILDQPDSYRINRNFKEWDVEVVNGWDESVFQELLSLNEAELSGDSPIKKGG